MFCSKNRLKTVKSKLFHFKLELEASYTASPILSSYIHLSIYFNFFYLLSVTSPLHVISCMHNQYRKLQFPSYYVNSMVGGETGPNEGAMGGNVGMLKNDSLPAK